MSIYGKFFAGQTTWVLTILSGILNVGVGVVLGLKSISANMFADFLMMVLFIVGLYTIVTGLAVRDLR